jgi:hypothetical protein
MNKIIHSASEQLKATANYLLSNAIFNPGLKNPKKNQYIILDDCLVLFKTTKVKFAFIDYQDIDLLKDYVWCSRDGYTVNNKLRLHVIICNRYDKSDPTKPVVDHIDQTTWNNCKYNLRFASYSQNTRNGKCHKDNKTGIKGLSHYQSSMKYEAYRAGDKASFSYKSKRTKQQAYQLALQWLDNYDLTHQGF